VAATSAMIWAADPCGHPSSHDWPFQYVSHQHCSTQAWPETEHQTALLKLGEVDDLDMPDVVFANPQDSTAKAMRLFGEATLANKQASHPSHRTIGPLSNASKLLERMNLLLKKDKERVEADFQVEEQIIQEAEALIRDIQAGKM
jgi:hypothetical protein